MLVRVVAQGRLSSRSPGLRVAPSRDQGSPEAETRAEADGTGVALSPKARQQRASFRLTLWASGGAQGRGRGPGRAPPSLRSSSLERSCTRSLRASGGRREAAHELLCSVGGAEDACGDDLFSARTLTRVLGERDQQIEAGADRKGKLSPTERSGQEGSGVSGAICASGQPARLGRRHLFIIC